jgi:hypothetical protein
MYTYNLNINTTSLLQGVQKRREKRVLTSLGQGCINSFERRQKGMLPASATNGHSAERGHYDRLCHGSRGINRIHTKSWILASVSSWGRSATPMLLQGTKSLRAMINCYACREENDTFNWSQLGTQLDTTTTQGEP